MSAPKAQLFTRLFILLPVVQTTHETDLLPFWLYASLILSNSTCASASRDPRFCRLYPLEQQLGKWGLKNNLISSTVFSISHKPMWRISYLRYWWSPCLPLPANQWKGYKDIRYGFSKHKFSYKVPLITSITPGKFACLGNPKYKWKHSFHMNPNVGKPEISMVGLN